MSLKDLELLLKRINVNDIRDTAIHEFPEVSWRYIEEKIRSSNEKLTKLNIISHLVRAVKNLDTSEIKRRISMLQLIVISTSKRTWYTIRMKDKGRNITTSDQLLRNIKSSFTRGNYLTDINIFDYENKCVISVVKKVLRKNKGMSYQQPIFFQYVNDYPYLFSTSTKILSDKTMLETLANGFGYKTAEKSNLRGRNIFDLLKLLSNKEGGVSDAKHLVDAALESSDPVTKTGVDFTQSANRKKIANQIFGKAPPQLQAVSITVKNATWQVTDGFEAMAGQSLNGIKMEFCSPDVLGMMKEMIVKGLVEMPIPAYMTAALTAAKNDFKINQY